MKPGTVQIALTTRTEIGVAMGVLMAQLRLNRAEAFDLLRIASQHTHRKLSAIATQVADTGELPDLAQPRLHGGSPTWPRRSYDFGAGHVPDPYRT